MKVVHIIAGLGRGGAEGTLYRLCAASGDNLEHAVISLTDEGVYGARLRSLGLVVESLNMPRGRLTAGGLVRLFRLLRALHPSIVQTWMYHADLVGGVVARMAGVPHVLWGIRHSCLDPGSNGRGLLRVARLCGLLSARVPRYIVTNAERSCETHAKLGYAREKFRVIPNGYDLSAFSPDRASGADLRLSLGVPLDAQLVGCVARWDPQKDHANLFAAMKRVWKTLPDVRLLCVGPGMTEENAVLRRLAGESGGRGKTILAGPRDDIPRVMNALELHVLSSAGEAFPNTVAEAMACGTPCVVTDVGDARSIVGDAGWVVPPHDPAALAGAMEEALSLVAGKEGPSLAERCRGRIVERFTLEKMVEAYAILWEKTAHKEVQA